MEQCFCVRWYTNAVQPKMINATPGTPSASPNPGVVATPTVAAAPPTPPIAPPVAIASGVPNSPTPNKKPGKGLNLKVILGLIVFLVVAVGGVAGYFLVQQEQDVRQQAGTGGAGGVPGFNSGACQNGLCACDSQTCNADETCFIKEFACDSNTSGGAAGCIDRQTNYIEGQGVATLPANACGTRQIDMGCRKNDGSGERTVGHTSWNYATACGGASTPPGTSPPPQQGWGACGSCGPCGPNNDAPANECVRAPDGSCQWDPGSCGPPGGGGNPLRCDPGPNNISHDCDGKNFGDTCNNGGTCQQAAGSGWAEYRPCECSKPAGPTSVCGQSCQTTADCKPAATGVAVVCRNNVCQNLTCPEGQTVPGANCSCGTTNRQCGQQCGHAFGLCEGSNGNGSMCVFTSGVACTAESQQTYCVGMTNWQVSNPAFTLNFCGNTGSGNSYLIRKADNKTTGFTEAEILSTCQICGDGIVQLGEECDEGTANGTPDSTCDTSCKRKAAAVYSCNSTCTTDTQCKTANPGFVCDPTARRCRLQSNPTSTTCQAPVAAACLNATLRINGQDVAVGSADPNIGDLAQVVCAQVQGAARYIFRVVEPDGTPILLSPLSGTGNNATNISETYTLTKPGAFKVQCQICTGPEDTSCLPFE